jgi:hypothetical protein
VTGPTAVASPLDPIVLFHTHTPGAITKPDARLDFLAKRRRLSSVPSTPVMRVRKRLKSVSFPPAIFPRTSSTTALTSYNPYVSALFPDQPRVEHEVVESKISIVNNVAARLLSRNYLLGLPTEWTENLANDQAHEAYDLLENLSVPQMERLVDCKFQP